MLICKWLIGINVNDNFTPTPKKDQLEYPSRFFIDKNLVLHKDNGQIHYKDRFKNNRIMFKHSNKVDYIV